MEQLLNPTPPPPASPPDGGTVSADLHCRTCDYNLRTLAWTAHCPECRTPVAASRIPDGYRIDSHANYRRLRLGVMILTAGILVGTLAHIQYVIVCMNWLQLLDAGHKQLVRASVRVWQLGYGYVALLIELAAMVVLAQVFARRHDRKSKRTARVLVALVAVALLGHIYLYIINIRGAGFPIEKSLILGWFFWCLELATILARPLGPLIVAFLLAGLVNRTRRKGLHTLLFLAAIAAAAVLVGEVCEVFHRVGIQVLSETHIDPNGRSYWDLRPQHHWLYGVQDFAYWWRSHVNDICWVVMLAAFGWFCGAWERSLHQTRAA